MHCELWIMNFFNSRRRCAVRPGEWGRPPASVLERGSAVPTDTGAAVEKEDIADGGTDPPREPEE